MAAADEDLPSALVEEYLNQKDSKGNTSSNQEGSNASAALPPGKQKSVDEVLAEMKRVPLFMNSLDDMDEDNEQLEAIRALVYEGTRAEVAENFKTQGNELVQTKHWSDAREFYTKAIQALKGPQTLEPGGGAKVVDEDAEVARERKLAEACHTNRALCNLELKNYGQCNRDCASALRFNPTNTKAYYRAASACLALDKLLECLDAINSGLAHDPSSAPLLSLRTRAHARQDHLASVEEARQKREQRRRDEELTLKHALKAREIVVRDSNAGDGGPEMEDAKLKLEGPLNAASLLTVPVLLLYPLEAQSDLVKACREDESLGMHLGYILPPPWDDVMGGGQGEYSTAVDVECYLETIQGGLIKAGKNLSLLRLLNSGKVEVVDGIVRVYVVPKGKAAGWIEEWKKRYGKIS